ncbi:magnesium transporter [Paenibacillus sp. NPDC056722]|uniref:magnesium transporter n=1 Tax=Paenibacillus sp. NPDC056722 TaxID=3345924 RepID=UPI003689DFF3
MLKLHQYKFREEYTYYMLQALKEGEREGFRKDFLNLHPSDQTDFFLTLDLQRRQRIYTLLSPAEFGEIFSELAPVRQKNIIQELDQTYAVEMLNDLPSDDATDFFGLLSHKQADFFLERMEKEEAEDIKHLLAYPKGSAGSLMTTDIYTIDGADTVTKVLNDLRLMTSDAETIYYLYVTDHNKRLLGVVSLRQLIVASAEQLILDLMSSKLITASPDAPRTEIVEIIKRYGLLAVPVVTPDNVLMGIVTFDDVV